MNYQKEILEKIKDSNNWSKFSNSETLDELNTFSDNFYKKQKLEGVLASVLIYHQLSEELMKCLVSCSDFLIQCSVFPLEFNKKRKEKNQMYGQIISEIEEGIIDKDIKEFIQKCKKLNELRIKIVHKLTSQTSIKDVIKETKQSKKYFDSIYELFDKIYDNYRFSFSRYKKNIDDMNESFEY